MNNVSLFSSSVQHKFTTCDSVLHLLKFNNKDPISMPLCCKILSIVQLDSPLLSIYYIRQVLSLIYYHLDFKYVFPCCKIWNFELQFLNFPKTDIRRSSLKYWFAWYQPFKNQLKINSLISGSNKKVTHT